MEKPSYKVGAEPRFRLAIANRSAVKCVRDVGPSQQELRLVAGGKRLWSSDDCAPKRGADVRTLQPGEKLMYWLTWGGRTSSPGCKATRVKVGPGSYQLVGRLGTANSKPVPFTLTR